MKLTVLSGLPDNTGYYPQNSQLLGTESSTGDNQLVSSLVKSGVSLITNLISGSRQTTLALKEQNGQLQEVIDQLKGENQQLDNEINKVKKAISEIKRTISSLNGRSVLPQDTLNYLGSALNGLDGFDEGLGKIFCIFNCNKKFAESDNTKLRTELEQLKQEQTDKIATLRALNEEYTRLAATLQSAEVNQAGIGTIPMILIGSIILGSAFMMWREQKHKD